MCLYKEEVDRANMLLLISNNYCENSLNNVLQSVTFVRDNKGNITLQFYHTLLPKTVREAHNP